MHMKAVPITSTSNGLSLGHIYILVVRVSQIVPDSPTPETFAMFGQCGVPLVAPMAATIEAITKLAGGAKSAKARVTPKAVFVML